MIKLITIFFSLLAIYILQGLFYKFTWGKNLDVNVSFSQKSAREGDKIILKEQVFNNKLLPVNKLKVNLSVSKFLKFIDIENTSISDRNYRSEIFSMGANEVITRDMNIICEKRGLYKINMVNLVSSDLFFSQKLVKNIEQDDLLYVLPGKAEPMQLLRNSRMIMGPQPTERSHEEDPFEFRGIRQYQSYDSMKDVNWSASAKTGELMVNLKEYTINQEIVLILNTNQDYLLYQDSILEESIRIISGLAGEFIGAEIMTSFYVNSLSSIHNSIIEVRAGSGHQHAISINKALAEIDNTFESEYSLKELLAHIEAKTLDNTKCDLTYVLVSSETNLEAIDAWNEFSSKVDSSWLIVPTVDKKQKISKTIEFELLYWEVAYDN